MKQSNKRLEDREIIVSTLTMIIEDLLDEEVDEDALFDVLLQLQQHLNNHRLEEGGT